MPRYAREPPFEQETIQLKGKITEHLPLLNDPHTEFVLLRNCLSLPKIIFTLSTTDTTRHQQEMQEFDQLTREFFTRILGAPLTDLEWAQAKLPVSIGGMGLRPSEDNPASLPPALLELLSTQQGEETSVESLEGMPQKDVSYKINLSNQTALINHSTGAGMLREMARLASLGLPHAGDWLNVLLGDHSLCCGSRGKSDET